MAVEIIKAIAELLGALAWPVAIVVAVFVVLRRHHAAVDRFIDRVETLSFPGGQADLRAVQEERETELESLVDQVAESETPSSPEARRADIEEITEKARILGRLEEMRARIRANPTSHIESMLIRESEKWNSRFKNPDNDPRGPWRSVDMISPFDNPERQYPVTDPQGNQFLPPPGRSWRYKKTTMDRLIHENRIHWRYGRPFQKLFRAEVDDPFTVEP